MLYNITHIMTISIQERTLLLMKIRKYTEARKHYKSGDIVWACAFSRTDNDNSLLYHTKPVKGMLVPYRTRHQYDEFPNWKYDSPSYFVPFSPKKQGLTIDDLAWSKQVSISARCYADTEDECIELYNELIDNNIAYFQQLIDEDKTYKI